MAMVYRDHYIFFLYALVLFFTPADNLLHGLGKIGILP